ncbi:MAG: hypothetical protein E2601_06295 [Microbacterium sp.]|nr:hypothetical protein [Microbacterium sp.]
MVGISGLNMEDINVAFHLEGLVLPGGWTVGSLNAKAKDARFSVSYPVFNEQGRQGFMKVLDLADVFGDIDDLNQALGDYIAERDLLMLCGEAALSRVVVAVAHGKVTLPDFMPTLSTAHYIIFEHADRGDLNDALSDAGLDDVAVRLDLIHDFAVGIRQLHKQEIAHQDIKPANALVFARPEGGNPKGKVADLGRAHKSGIPTSHSGAVVPGDRSFAPPELLYGYQHPDIATRRFGGDVYQLGSLICYAFSGVTMNALLSDHLATSHHWDSFGDGYPQALPYLEGAFAAALTDLEETLPRSVAPEVLRLVTYLCEPDLEQRGHPRSRGAYGSRFALERVVGELNLAAVRARSRAGLHS